MNKKLLFLINKNTLNLDSIIEMKSMKANHKFDTIIFWSKDPGKTLPGKRDRERITLAGKQDRERITLAGKRDRERIFTIQEILQQSLFSK